jgi:hypothetical protein
MDILAESYDWDALIAGKVPALNEAVGTAVRSQAALLPAILTDNGTHQSVRLIFSQLVNDFIALMSELQAGSGRQAMRTSRTLIEHAINLHTVLSDLQEAQRYVEHLDQGPALMLDLQVGADRLDKRSRRQYLHRLRRLGRDSGRRFDAAKENWGSSFARHWSSRSLADRAERHGLEELYALYRLASLVTHGSAGGVLGNVRAHDEESGGVTYRLGPALELAPVAMAAGLEAYLHALQPIANLRADIDMNAYRSGLYPLAMLWPDYFKALSAIDAEVWPDEPSHPPVAVLAVSRSGHRRWYLHLPWASMLLPGDEPDMEPWLAARLDELVDRVTSAPEEHFLPNTQWVSIRVESVTVNPIAGKPIPDTGILLRPEDRGEDWRFVEIPGLSRPPGE